MTPTMVVAEVAYRHSVIIGSFSSRLSVEYSRMARERRVVFFIFLG